ncbi:D-tagatose-bisphosphate aldolase, class II, non-catalytic subunit [Terriglobus saanensis]|uniref:D-tagatose-bisphosphate aldolase, class II, non-catalytic subunit n=1 Tax=Terriglobus saanensis (strain ATCC BAA-1853 / DSM 23119 / SP1PR4) TaxID=401053 RepID=E8V0X6_TERSS|nr:D-tagatose-bisphosphate aldolase, class II, non-catalytic subunit [Terriglobus saanensis]ADV82267.1 D-tagatose-bisphosphate aldolase, class II, non-catalytic subunit [Terriglobus saanensis SP1PR4]
MFNLLESLLANRKTPNSARGIYSVCSAHPWVIRAAIQQALSDESPLLIEATSNQVNQHGGYTGLRPADFRRMVVAIAEEEGLSTDRIIFGGDHLGPNAWQKLPAEEAMALAKEMMAEYAAAGFKKLHLDASMACAGETVPLSDEVVAERAAQLCLAAEAALTGERPVYIIGTEVPIPGGATEALTELEVTTRAAAENTLRIHHEIFNRQGLGVVWPRVVGLVVQPGVEFNHDSVVDYIPAKAEELKSLLDSADGLVFEAHSTDYQKPAAYRDLVLDGFAILKVGPALTFAMREAIFALAAIEDELIAPKRRSSLRSVVEEAMVSDPKDWVSHYHGSPEEQRLLRRYSYSDRIRYYWGHPSVQKATDLLISNLNSLSIPETLLSAQMPEHYKVVRARMLSKRPVDLILYSIREALKPYAAACFPASE